MPAFVNKIGKRFGKLVAKNVESRNGRYWYYCECDCGNLLWVAGGNLHINDNRGTRTCGCSKDGNPTHGLTGTPEHRIWKSMRRRCNNPNDISYKFYGARGIKVCKRWDSFENFLADMGKRPSNKYSIERKKVNKDYSPSNCYWVINTRQNRNRRDTVYITYQGKKLAMVDWADLLGIKQSTFRRRYYMGMPLDRMMRKEKLHKSR